MKVTLKEIVMGYQRNLFNPAMSPGNHTGTIQPVVQAQEQPMPGMVVDPVMSQSAAEERFFAEQMSSGFQVMQSGIVETTADEANLRLFQEQNQLPGVPELADPYDWDAQLGYPELQQQAGNTSAPEPMPHPAMFGLGGW